MIPPNLPKRDLILYNFKPVKTIDSECKTHDVKYLAKVYRHGGVDTVSICPECSKEDVARIDRIEREQARTARAEVKQQNNVIAMRGSAIPEKYLGRTLDNYRAETDGQKKALKAAREFADNFSEYCSYGGSLVFIGSPGTGKTHLSCAIAGQLLADNRTAAFVKVSEMIRAIRRTYKTDDDEQDVIDKYSSVGLLVIDEIGLQRGSEDELRYTTEIIDNRVNGWRPTILITNLSVDKMKELLGVRTWDRLTEGQSKIVKFGWESYRKHVKNDSDLPRGAA